MRSKDNSPLEHGMMLYSLLPSSAEMSRRALEKLLEEKSIYGTNNTVNYRVHHLLIHAYVLHAICTQETAPNSIVLLQRSEFIQDISSAVELCLNPEHGYSDNQYDVKFEDMLYLWYLVIDLLSIKGYVEILPGTYDVVTKLFKRKSFSLEKTMTELWKNLRLGHALCVSPLNHKLMRNFSKQWSELCDSNEFWKSCMKELNPFVAGFHHIDKEIKQTASDLISHVPISSASMFLHSHHCYKFAGRLISTGRMIEALSYAKEAHRLRGKLLQQKFEYSVEKRTETCDENGEIFEKSYYDVKTLKENDVMMIKGSCDHEGCILTPWNVLRCYLESILQVGVVHEILGNGSKA